MIFTVKKQQTNILFYFKAKSKECHITLIRKEKRHDDVNELKMTLKIFPEKSFHESRQEFCHARAKN